MLRGVAGMSLERGSREAQLKIRGLKTWTRVGAATVNVTVKLRRVLAVQTRKHGLSYHAPPPEWVILSTRPAER